MPHQESRVTSRSKSRFATLSASERIQLVTQGKSISDYANGRAEPLPAHEARDLERRASKGLRDVIRALKPETA